MLTIANVYTGSIIRISRTRADAVFGAELAEVLRGYHPVYRLLPFWGDR